MPKLYIYADTRETPSNIPDILKKQGITVYVKNLSVADYIISDRCAIERKTVSDFTASIFDGRLIDQFKRLSETYETPLLIIEGDINELYSDQIRRNYLLKIIIELSLDFNTRIIFTPNRDMTANTLISITRYEQFGKGKHPLTRRKPKNLSEEETLEFILMGFPMVGNKIAKNMLTKFGTLRNVFSSSSSELARVKGVGKQLADQISKILDFPYTHKKTDESTQKKLEI
ncbi:MAG: ERCC4 domain-containing protein [Candidatus Odinarchaeia archaeon]